MKKIVCLLFFVSMGVLGQEAEKKPSIEFEPGFHIGWSQAIATGKTALNDGYSAAGGGNVQLDLVNYRNILLGVGASAQLFNVTDPSIVGEFESAAYSSVYVAASYKYRFSKRWILLPSIGVGASRFRIRESNDLSPSFQKGREVRIGSTINFQLDKAFWMYVGAGYTWSKMGINTTPEFENYYSNFSHVQFQLGLYFF